jgi:hypothetical protein
LIGETWAFTFLSLVVWRLFWAIWGSSESFQLFAICLKRNFGPLFRGFSEYLGSFENFMPAIGRGGMYSNRAFVLEFSLSFLWNPWCPLQ